MKRSLFYILILTLFFTASGVYAQDFSVPNAGQIDAQIEERYGKNLTEVTCDQIVSTSVVQSFFSGKNFIDESSGRPGSCIFREEFNFDPSSGQGFDIPAGVFITIFRSEKFPGPKTYDASIEIGKEIYNPSGWQDISIGSKGEIYEGTYGAEELNNSQSSIEGQGIDLGEETFELASQQFELLGGSMSVINLVFLDSNQNHSVTIAATGDLSRPGVEALGRHVNEKLLGVSVDSFIPEKTEVEVPEGDDGDLFSIPSDLNFATNLGLNFSPLVSWTLVGIGGALVIISALMFTGGKSGKTKNNIPIGAGNLQKTPVGYVSRPAGAGAPPGFVRTASGGLKAISSGMATSKPPVQQTRKITEPVQQIPKKVEVNPELIDYIKKAREAGQKDFAIQSALLAAGWDSKVVSEHLKNK